MKSILLNLASSLIWFIMGYMVHRLIDEFRNRGKTKILNKYHKAETVAIVLSTRSGPYITSTLRTSLPEVNALINVILYFQKLKLQYRIVYDEPVSIIQNYSNILSIGGFYANQMSAFLLERYKDRIPVKLHDKPVSYEVGNKTYSPEYSEDGKKLLADYALILVICPDENVAGMYILVSGCRGYGTQEGVRCLTDKVLLERQIRDIKSFVAIVRVDCQTGKYTSTIKEFYLLMDED